MEVIESMADGGWNGRPLLVEEVKDYGEMMEYYAWTGSHRIEAAIILGLSEIPCFVIEAEEADSAFSSHGHERRAEGYSSWRGYVGPTDAHRFQALESVGLRAAAELLKQEPEHSPHLGSDHRRR